ncbi:MAG: hypothetical protein IBX45_00825 [Campylobacterales bacterium]|nr:hypothetical protein [Campylobacterales bacterium]
MALKENLNAIKQGLSTEEQFLEGMIKSERFFKKYKWTLVSGVVIVALLGVGYAITDTLKTKHLRTANQAYRAVLANPDDAVALKTLKESSSVLYGTHAAQVALNANEQEALEAILVLDVDVLLRDLASYQLNGTSEGLLSNLGALQRGYLLLKEGKTEAAKVEFAAISLSSPLQNVVKNLEHFQGE